MREECGRLRNKKKSKRERMRERWRKNKGGERE